MPLRNSQLGYTIDQGIISISTDDELAKNTLTRVYDVRDLLRGLDKNGADARQQAIVKAVLSIDPKSCWRENGGQAGSVRALQGSLIVTQTPERQEHVLALIERLRAVINPGIAPVDKNILPLAPAK